MSEREVLKRIIPYVPPYWVRQAFADPEHTLVGREGRIYAAVLFVDISGFTTISEALSRRGREGVEELSAILDRYFTAMAEPVVALGGEVVKFAGDSLIVLFPAPSDGSEAHLGAALHCSLRMQKAMARFSQVHTSAGTFPLRMKIGIGEGAIYNTTVGDEEKGMQPVFAGRPLARCMQAEDHAGAGEIVADAALVSRIPGRLDIGEARGTFRLIAGATDMPVLPPIEQVDVSAIGEERAALLVRRLSPYLPAQVVERIRQGQRGVHSEHRRITIMFVKFGGLNYDWEPQVGYVLQVYFTTMRDHVLRYGGRLNEVDIGADGGTLVIFFGAPTAHEDDELRAISCAWEMQQAVADVRLQAGEAAARLRQCIGISSGTVFVGDVGAPVRRTYAAVGDDVNLAARLMNLAEWGEVVATRRVQKRAASRFDFEEMGEVRVKGKAEPVPLFALIAPRLENAKEALLYRLLDRRPSVDRERELKVLAQVRERAWRGQPQLLTITGEAGIGKSHLMGELARAWVESGGHVYAGDCRQEGGDEPYGLWSGVLRTAFATRESDSPERRRERIESGLVLLSPSLSREIAVFEQLLDRRPPVGKEEREQIHRTMGEFLHVSAHRQPLLLALDHLQEIDCHSLALLNALTNDLADLPLLICAAWRPCEIHLDEGSMTATHLELEELTEEDSLTLAGNLLEKVRLPTELAGYIVAQARGNPFYIQETVRALGGLAEFHGLEAARNALMQGQVVPEEVSSTIQSQVDQLDEDFKLGLRIAAVIGQQFDFQVLLAAHNLSASPKELAERLATLERMRLIRREGFGDNPSYSFRHPITRQVIYAGLLRADRERFHRQVGEAIERVYAGQLERWYESLAGHFAEGKVTTKVVAYLAAAGRREERGRCWEEACQFYTRALDTLSELPSDVALSVSLTPGCARGVRLMLLFGRGRARERLSRIAGAVQDYRQAAHLARELGDLLVQGDSLLRIGAIAARQARCASAMAAIRRAAHCFSAEGQWEGMSKAMAEAGWLYASQGRTRRAVHYLEMAVEGLDAVQDLSGAARCRVYLGALHCWSGRFSQAMDHLRRAIEVAGKVDDRAVAARGMAWRAQVLMYRGRWERALQVAREGVRAARQADSLLMAACAWQSLAHLLARVGAYEESLQTLEEVLPLLDEARWWAEGALALELRGESLLALGRRDEAEKCLLLALERSRRGNVLRAVVCSLLGLARLAAAGRNWAEQQRLSMEARALARQAELIPLVLAARIELARAYLGQREWRAAQREASQALDACRRLRCPYETLQAVLLTGESLGGLGQVGRARRHFREAIELADRLTGSLPPTYRAGFQSVPCIRALSKLDTTPYEEHELICLPHGI